MWNNVLEMQHQWFLKGNSATDSKGVWTLLRSYCCYAMRLTLTLFLAEVIQMFYHVTIQLTLFRVNTEILYWLWYRALSGRITSQRLEKWSRRCVKSCTTDCWSMLCYVCSSLCHVPCVLNSLQKLLAFSRSKNNHSPYTTHTHPQTHSLHTHTHTPLTTWHHSLSSSFPRSTQLKLLFSLN